MKTGSIRLIVAGAAALAAAGPAMAMEPITFAQFFQTSGAKVVVYNRGPVTTLNVTNASVLLNILAFGTPQLITTTYNMTASSTDPVLLAPGGGFTQNGFSGQLSFTNANNWLTANFTGATLRIFEGGGSGSFGASMPPNMIQYSSDILNLPSAGVADFALAFSAISPIFTATSTTFNANVSGTFAVIPEPATWALLIAGFGLVGVAARRSRRRTVMA